MKSAKSFLLHFLAWTAYGMMGRGLFLLVYRGMIEDLSAKNALLVLLHGLRLDIAIAGYVTAIPALMLISAIWYRSKVQTTVWKTYEVIVATVYALAITANIGLYRYWGFPLDNTPLLYIKTSPSDAAASMTPLQIALATAVWIALAAIPIVVTTKKMESDKTTQKASISWTQRALQTLALLLMAAALIIPIRGGFGTGTNHTGSVYFCNNMRLNHAAVNPVFCFVESVIHQKDYANQYHFMEDDECEEIFRSMSYTSLRDNATDTLLTTTRPNIILVIMEGFSKYIMEEAGHVHGVTPCLDSLSHEGIYFSNFYSSSFRTDRGMVSILSALPAQPTMSLMDMPRKTNGLYSLPKALAEAGYSTHFYYGGDTDYSNMRTYLTAGGFENITSEEDFPRGKGISKWGAEDGIVLSRVLEEIPTDNKPFFTTILTLSSHEPFDVPYKSGLGHEALNAFAYTDNCLNKFLNGLKKKPCWKETLVVLVPDHLGAYPDEIDNYQPWRYEIPLIMTGGAVRGHHDIDVPGAQIDITATLLGMLGISHERFPFSKDMLDTESPHFAFFTFPDAMGLVDENGMFIWDNVAEAVVLQQNENKESQVKAYLQQLFRFIDKL